MCYTRPRFLLGELKCVTCSLPSSLSIPGFSLGLNCEPFVVVVGVVVVVCFGFCCLF